MSVKAVCRLSILVRLMNLNGPGQGQVVSLESHDA